MNKCETCGNPLSFDGQTTHYHVNAYALLAQTIRLRDALKAMVDQHSNIPVIEGMKALAEFDHFITERQVGK